MKDFQVSRDIIPIAKFKSHASSIMEDVKANHKSVIITKNGEAAGVLICPEDYDRWIERDRFLQSINQGLDDSRSGRTLSDTDFKETLEKEFGNLNT
ncbi:MAG: type II toxin-antitoxin system Phd/YefM family antitoxin [Spirochaetales bacterium]|nr:type II toxin-antitoxin system Phd/YefM family antitoxin [Spirochaetales bacterium]